MKNSFVLLFLLVGLISSCVSSKKFKELTEKNKICSEELENYKRSSMDFESKFKDFKALYDVASEDVFTIKKDTTILGSKYRNLFHDFQVLTAENEALENSAELGKYAVSKCNSLPTLSNFNCLAHTSLILVPYTRTYAHQTL